MYWPFIVGSLLDQSDTVPTPVTNKGTANYNFEMVSILQVVSTSFIPYFSIKPQISRQAKEIVEAC